MSDPKPTPHPDDETKKAAAGAEALTADELAQVAGGISGMIRPAPAPPDPLQVLEAAAKASAGGTG